MQKQKRQKLTHRRDRHFRHIQERNKDRQLVQTDDMHRWRKREREDRRREGGGRERDERLTYL